jgi:hypothetical protein
VIARKRQLKPPDKKHSAAFGCFSRPAAPRDRRDTKIANSDTWNPKKFDHRLQVLLTTCNFPDVMLPAYASSRVSSLFFVSFVAICCWLLQSLVLATVLGLGLAPRPITGLGLSTAKA